MPDTYTDATLFPALTPEQIEWLRTEGEEITVPAGTVLFEENSPADTFYVILDGQVKVTRQVAGEDITLTVHEPGEFMGEISLLTRGTCIATGRATLESRLIRMDIEALRHVLLGCSSAGETILVALAQRRPEAMILSQQREKLAALGKLSAGLAHELNNPAAAAQRASEQLRETWETMQPAALKLGELCLNAEKRDWLAQMQAKVLAEAREAVVLDPLARSDREEEIAAWLEGQGVENVWDLAPALTDSGIGLSCLKPLSEKFGDGALTDVVSWLASGLVADALLRQITGSMERISALVKAVKAYSYMDQSPTQNINVQDGLESTLMILAYKLRGGITLQREYTPNLPRITAYGSELNQVWTNLIVNAVEAMDGKGILRLKTAQEGECLLVEIGDNGPGIPPEIQSRIFDPFFTTKGVGEGTGLGLDTCYRIVVARHKGDLSVVSQPGDTRFQVRLPG